MEYPRPQSVIRAARPEDAEAALETLCAAFDLNVDAARPIFYADPYYDLSHKRVLTLPNAGIVSCLTIVPVMLRVGGIPVQTAGIAGVATRPEWQRQGLAAALLEATLPALDTELGYALSLLHPRDAPFYRRFGWEFTTRTLRWTAAPAALSLPAAASVRPVLDADWPAIHHLHAELTRSETAACVRDERRWLLVQMPIPGREAYVCDNERGSVEGYLICERGEALHLLEMHGKTPEARRALLGFLGRQPEGMIEWPTSEVLLSQFGLLLPNTPEPDAMLRIVNLEAALAAIHAAHYAPVLAATGMTLTIQAVDVFQPRNQRPLCLTPQGIVRGDPHDRRRVQTDIGTLAQLYLGYALPSEAAASGLLTADAPETLALADRLFPARCPFLAPLDQV